MEQPVTQLRFIKNERLIMTTAETTSHTLEKFRQCMNIIRGSSEFFMVHSQNAYKVRVATDFYSSEYYDVLGIGCAVFCLVGADKEVQEALDWLVPQIINGKRTANGFSVILDKSDINSERPVTFKFQ